MGQPREERAPEARLGLVLVLVGMVAFGQAEATTLPEGETTLHFTTPSFGIDTLANDCATPDSTIPQNIVLLKVWSARCHVGGHPILMRSRATSTGVADTIIVPSRVPEDCATWWVSFVNARGLESCFSNGATVGIPPTGVDERASDDASEWPGAKPGETFDLRGARLSTPICDLPDGVYFRRITPDLVFRIVVREGQIVGVRRKLPRRRAEPL